MLVAAFLVLGAAVLVGSVLALQHLRTVEAPHTPWPLILTPRGASWHPTSAARLLARLRQ